MIIRSWTGYTSRANGSAYEAFLRDVVIPELRAIDGFLDILVLRRETGEDLEYRVDSSWRSLDSIKAFAGEDIDRAVVESEAQRLLLRFDDEVRHYEAVLDNVDPLSC